MRFGIAKTVHSIWVTVQHLEPFCHEGNWAINEVEEIVSERSRVEGNSAVADDNKEWQTDADSCYSWVLSVYSFSSATLLSTTSVMLLLSLC